MAVVKYERIRLGEDLCRQWGIDPSHVKSITLEMDGSSAVAVIRRFLKDDDLPGFLEAVGEYELAPKGWREAQHR